MKRKTSLFFILISSVIFIYIIYRSEFFHDGNQRFYYYPYIIANLIFLFYSIVCNYLKKIIRIYLNIIFISFLFSIYAFEGYIGFIKKPINRDIRTKHQLYEIYKNNPNINFSKYPNSFLDTKSDQFHLSGISNSQIIHCNESGYYSKYNSDRYGFNNPDNQWDFNEVEYVLLGDSFLHGACVNRPNDISSVIRELSNKIVLNLGMSGNSTLIQYATLREYALKKKIKNIIVFFYEGNDLNELNNELSNKILLNYLYDKKFVQNLKLKQNFINDKIKKEIDKDFRNAKLDPRSIIIEFLKLYNLRNYYYSHNQLKQKNDKISDEFKKILNLMKEFALDNNSKLSFVYMPEYLRYNKKKYKNSNYEKIISICRELNIEFLDLTKEVFDKEKSPLNMWVFGLPNHYNVYGYNKIANFVYNSTKQE